MIEFTVKNHLIIVNNSNTSTFLASYGESNIDLTFVDRNIFDSINYWRVETIETNPDHNYITFEFECNQQSVNIS